ncbi:hypothetical protein ACFLQN_03855 [Candidatus Aenigmatarchaeota archaeon]
MKGISKILAIAIVVIIIIIILAIIAINPVGQYSLSEQATNPPCNSHKECVGDLCRKVSGCGPNECNTHADCTNQTNVTHTECINELCSEVQGAGTDECEFNYQCTECDVEDTLTEGEIGVYAVGMYQYNITALIVNQTFAKFRVNSEISGELEIGESELFNDDHLSLMVKDIDRDAIGISGGYIVTICLNDNEVTSNETHTECIGDFCTTIYEAGTDECVTNEDCMNQTNQTDDPPVITELYHDITGAGTPVNGTNTTEVTIFTSATDDIDLAIIRIYVDDVNRKMCGFYGSNDLFGNCTYVADYIPGNYTYYSRAWDSSDQMTQSDTQSFYVE